MKMKMRQMLCKAELGLTRELNQISAASARDKHQQWEWSPPPQQQHVSLTRGKQNDVTHTLNTGASSVHPLVPLLLCSDRHVPPSSPFARPTPSPAAAWTDTHCKPRPSNTNANRQSAQVKKPLNAFMLYMKETRRHVLQEGRERESAAINRILGRRWRDLTHEERAKYYELAKEEKQLHTQLHPGWSARDNYGKRKRKRRQQ